MAIETRATLREWKTEPPQASFLLDEETDEILYGGAKGGGKSDALLIFHWKRRHQYAGSTGIIIRRKFTELTKPGALIPRSHELFSGQAAWNGETRTWTWPNKSILAFGHCEDDAAAFDYQGTEVADLGFDQLEQFTELQVGIIRGANRTTRTDLKPLMRATANPGGIGHLHVKKRYIDPPMTPWTVYQDPHTQRTRRFIPATVADNPHLNPSYVQNLEELPEPWRSAWLLGRWDVFVGQFFSEWDPGLHTCDPFAIPRHWRRFGMLDYGFSAPFCYLQAAYSPDGTLYVYRERYQPRVLDTDQAAAIALACQGDTPEYIVAGPDLWHASGKGARGQSTAETYQEVWKRLRFQTRLVMADTDRITGWRRMREWLKPLEGPDGDVRAMLQVTTDCPNLIRTIPGLIHDDLRPEDLDSDGEDHACDAARFGLMSRPAPKAAPLLPPGPMDTAVLFKRLEQRRRKVKRIGWELQS